MIGTIEEFNIAGGSADITTALASERNFERRFQLADYVVVTDANLADGYTHGKIERAVLTPAQAQQIMDLAASPEALDKMPIHQFMNLYRV